MTGQPTAWNLLYLFPPLVLTLVNFMFTFTAYCCSYHSKCLLFWWIWRWTMLDMALVTQNIFLPIHTQLYLCILHVLCIPPGHLQCRKLMQLRQQRWLCNSSWRLYASYVRMYIVHLPGEDCLSQEANLWTAWIVFCHTRNNFARISPLCSSQSLNLPIVQSTTMNHLCYKTTSSF